jgi:hypothetical protein
VLLLEKHAEGQRGVESKSGEGAERGQRWRLVAFYRQREGRVVEGAVALANRRPRASVTWWGQGDVATVASARGSLRGDARAVEVEGGACEVSCHHGAASVRARAI